MFRYIYDQIQVEMIQFNNSNPDYGIPEYEGGDADDTVNALTLKDVDETLNVDDGPVLTSNTPMLTL